jgi:hypothetical protein
LQSALGVGIVFPAAMLVGLFALGRVHRARAQAAV